MPREVAAGEFPCDHRCKHQRDGRGHGGHGQLYEVAARIQGINVGVSFGQGLPMIHEFAAQSHVQAPI
jgi:hypothetical protein